MYRLFFGPLLLLCCATQANEVLLGASTENLAEPIIHPEPALVDYLLQHDTEFAEMINQCNDNKVPGRLLSDTRLDFNGDKIMDHFIRPVLEPYCIYLYGAHTFSWWLVTETPEKKYNILFAGYSDAIDILQTQHQNHKDLRVKNATAVEMMIYEFHYQGDAYKMVNCTQEKFSENGKSTSKPCET